MKTAVKLSVIIPAYNVEEYLEGCLKSVMSQKNSSFEVILVNDGSEDGTSLVCRKWADKYKNIRFFEQENRGQGSARNLGIRHAAGEWLVFLDADDEMLPGALENLEKNAADDFDVLWYESRIVFRDQAIQHRKVPENIREKSRLMQAMTPELWDKMFRASLWRQENIYLSDLYGEDNYAVYLLSAKSKAIRTLPVLMVCHFERPDGLTQKPWRVSEISRSHANVLERFSEEGLLEPFRLPLFLMVEKEYSNHCRLWKDKGREESGMIAGELGGLARKYFPEEHRRLSKRKQGTLVLIGRQGWALSSLCWFWDVCCFESMEHFLAGGYRPGSEICHFIIDVENETRAVRTRVRTLEWALSYWKLQCAELEHLRTANKLQGDVFLYCFEQKKSYAAECFEKAAAEYWNYARPESPGDLWEKLCAWNALKRDAPVRREKQAPGSFNYRWECLRLNENTDLLVLWLRVKQRGGNLEGYFTEKGYSRIGIYGAGYQGRLLMEELKDSRISVLFLIDRNDGLEVECRLYSPRDILPPADAVVVTVAYEYERIRSELQCVCRVISLREVIDWCDTRGRH